MLIVALPLLADDVDTGQAFSRVTLAGRGELATALSDPKVGVEQKGLAIRRLAELTKDLGSQPSVSPSELSNPIVGVLALKGEKYEVLRRLACEALVMFSDHKGSETLVKPLGNTLNNASETNEVRTAAAISLGRYTQDKAAAAEELVRALSAHVADGPRGDNIRLVSTVIDAVGRLRDKRSFVPLMRVIQSNFPTSAKKSAQRALENIDWDR